MSCHVTHPDNSSIDIYLMTRRDFNVVAEQLSIQWQPHAHTTEIHCQKENMQKFYIMASQLKYLKKKHFRGLVTILDKIHLCVFNEYKYCFNKAFQKANQNLSVSVTYIKNVKFREF